jgi:type I restriction enzyme, R subunit
MHGYTEDTLVQQTTARYLCENLGWDESIYAMDEKFGSGGILGRETEREIVLRRYLMPKLAEFNPGLPRAAYEDACRRITETSASQSMLITNREKDDLYRNGVDVIFRNEKGEKERKRVRVFDFDKPENNHFLAVRELWLRGDIYRRRADIVGFVNGIPLIFMEVKNLHRDVRAAYEQNFCDYKDTVPHLFYHNAVVILGNGDEAKIGSVSSQYGHFGEWKRLSEEDPGVVDMETLLRGVCSKENFMDLFENYIIFDDSGEGTAKIIGRNHQFIGVNNAVEAVRHRKERQGRLGVFWHTQGSGKSYSIAFFVRKVLRKLGGNFTFLVLTDRDDLDTQIYQTLAGCGLADNDKDPCRAGSGDHLKELLGLHKTAVFSLIQKFNKPVEAAGVYSERDDIIVITDEAHRTQYGTLSLNMRNALPNASYIGFTGTPLFRDDEITRRVFGEYVSTYDFQRAVEDGATVPLYYDSRGEKLGVATQDINERIAAKLEEIETDDINVEQRLEAELKRDYHIITAGKRLEQIAEDFVSHYSEGWENGKAMMICIDKITCVRMHGLIKTCWEKQIGKLESQCRNATDDQDLIFLERKLAWMRGTQTAVVISEEQGEVDKFRKWGLDILPHRKLIKNGFTTDQGERIDLDTAFKREQHPFRIAIVCNMWLTGFNVPCLSTLYLDKPLKAHTLMQTIARANRVNEGKNNGLIVDYCGILKNLRKALATFAGSGGRQIGGEDEKEPVKPESELLAELEEAIDLVMDFLVKRGFELEKIKTSEGFSRNAAIIEAKEAININDRTRKEFEVMAREVFKKFKACINIRPQINEYRHDRDAIGIIYKSLQKDREQADISDIIRKLHKVVDDSIDVRNAESDADSKLYDISRIDFDRLKQEFAAAANKRTIVQDLRHAVEMRLAMLLELNPLRTDFQRHYEDIVAVYNREKDRVTIEQTFEALLKYTELMDEEEQRAIKEGLDEETLALFDLLVKPDLTKKEIDRLKKVAVDLLETLKAEKLKVENWREKETTRDAVRQGIFDYLYDDATGLPVDSYKEEEINRLTDNIYGHVYRAYPTLPSPIYSSVA